MQQSVRLRKMLTPELRERIERLVGEPLQATRPVPGGYTPALRLIASMADGRSVFVKVGTDEHTAGALRQEHRVYESLSGSFLPNYLGWDGGSDGEEQDPILILEDLSAGFWPPPWNETRVSRVVGALEEVWDSTLEGLPRLETFTPLASGWQAVADEPEPFLSLSLATQEWLSAALPTLLAIDGTAVLHGESLLHLDVRSDNICFMDGRTLLIDWNWVCVGNPAFDLGAWAPSLEVEGGPAPEALLPDAGEIAALVSGYFASHAGLPAVPGAPELRPAQQRLAESALPWAVRTLGLPALDGRGRS